METQSNNLNFDGQNIYVGIDVHKKDWAICLRNDEFELKKFRQPPQTSLLATHLKRNYPGAHYHCVYEAGFCGFWIEQELKAEGINCMVVNAADVPTSNKEKKHKSDKVDCRKLSRELSSGNLKAIYIPDQAHIDDRKLVRTRDRFVVDQTRLKNRIQSMLDFYGIKIPESFPNSSTWSKKFIAWLEELEFKNTSAKSSLLLLLEQYKMTRKLVVQATKALQILAATPAHADRVKLLRSIPGIGIINSMIILTELGNIKRFKDIDHLCSFAGFVPNVYASGDTEHIGQMTRRGNNYLREAIIESSWVIIRKDPAMLSCYNRYCKRMNPNKAIIKIARKLLSRIRYVLLTNKEYELSTTQIKKSAEFSKASAARIDTKKPKQQASASAIPAG